MQTKRPRIGRQMIRAVRFISQHPGCAKTDVAAHLHGPDDRSHNAYATLKCAQTQGLIRATPRIQRGPLCYALNVTPLGNQLIGKNTRT